MFSSTFSEDGSDQELGLKEEPCNPTTPEPPEEAMEPSQHDYTTNILVPIDPISPEDHLEGTSTALTHRPSEFKPPPIPLPVTDASALPIN